MNTIIQKAIVSVLVSIAMTTSIAIHAEEYPKAPEYVNPTGTEFPIVAYYTFVKENLVTLDNYMILKDCGFNLGLGWSNQDGQEKMLELADKAGIRLLVNCPQTRNIEDIDKLIRRFEKYPNCAGFYLWDEPSASLFDKIKVLISDITDSGNGRLAYVNLFPNYAAAKQLGTHNYPEYIKKFITETNPQFVSYDNYCIREKDGRLSLRKDYYENLETVRDICKDAGIPVWTFCLSMAHLDYPVPTKAQILFQVFSGLAYGSQAIQYYNYSIADLKGISPIDENGNRRDFWYDIRDVNRQVQSLSHVFLGCEVIDVWHTGQSVPQGTKRLKDSFLPAEISHVESTGTGVVVSHIKNKDKNYLLIVNRDFENSQKVRIKKNAAVSRINEKGKTVRDSRSIFRLEAGGWRLYCW